MYSSNRLCWVSNCVYVRVNVTRFHVYVYVQHEPEAKRASVWTKGTYIYLSYSL